jgi:Ca2+-binding EF-hand superfamily protein
VTSKEWGRGVSSNAAILSKFFGGASLEEIGRQFRRIDLDQSRSLSWSEIVRGARSLGAALTVATYAESDSGSRELRKLFNSLDKNGDGRVSSKEWGAALSRHSGALAKHFGGASLAEIGQMFKRLDRDASGDLTWDEFVHGARRFNTTISRVSAAQARFDARFHAASPGANAAGSAYQTTEAVYAPVGGRIADEVASAGALFVGVEPTPVSMDEPNMASQHAPAQVPSLAQMQLPLLGLAATKTTSSDAPAGIKYEMSQFDADDALYDA